MNFEGVTVCHVERLRRIIWLNSCAVEEKPDRLYLLALSSTESVHELLQLRRSLDLEENFVIAVRDLDIQVLGWLRSITASTIG